MLFQFVNRSAQSAERRNIGIFLEQEGSVSENDSNQRRSNAYGYPAALPIDEAGKHRSPRSLIECSATLPRPVRLVHRAVCAGRDRGGLALTGAGRGRTGRRAFRHCVPPWCVALGVPWLIGDTMLLLLEIAEYVSLRRDPVR